TQTWRRRHRPVAEPVPLRLPDPGASRDQARRRQQGGPAMNGDKTRHAIRLDRRRFLQVLAGTAGALVVGIRVADAAGAPLPPALLGENFHDLGAYVRIDGDGNSNGQPRWTYGRQVGGSGGSIPAAWNDLRQVGALARWLLMQAAARRLGVSANRLRCDSGTVIAPDGRRVTYGSLAADASQIALPASAPALKAAANYQLVGYPAGDVDAHDIVTGQARYAIDQHLGDALVAVLVHCPWPDGTLSRIDTSETLAVKGVVKVVQLKPEPGQPWGSTVIAPAVAVLAKDTWAALQGRAKLKLEWKPGASAGESSAALEQQALATLGSQAEPTTRVRDDGDFDAAGKKAARRFEATYFQPWLADATSEPMNCLVRLDKDRASLVVPTQAPQKAWAVVQRLT